MIMSSLSLKNEQYDRFWSSKNCRRSPFSIDVLLFNSAGEPIHKHPEDVMSIIDCVYLWNSTNWAKSLRGDNNKSTILRTKSDFYWESLAQHVSERIFNVHITPAIYLCGPNHDEDEKLSSKNIFSDVHHLTVITSIECGSDPLNPVSRTITFIATAATILIPEIFIDVSVPSNVLLAVSPYQEVLDMRPRVRGDDGYSPHNYVIRAHIPAIKKRTRNTDYPDFNLFFIPCRHLVFQGHVDDPKYVGAEDGIFYENLNDCLDRFQFVVEKLCSKPGSLEISDDIAEFITSKYYYAYDDENHSVSNETSGSNSMGMPSISSGNSFDSLNPSDDDDVDETETTTANGLPHFYVEKFHLAQFREYILSDTYGVGRGLAHDFDFVELHVDNTHHRSVRM